MKTKIITFLVVAVLLLNPSLIHAGPVVFDTDFDTDGIATHNSAAGGNSTDFGFSIQVQSDGKYTVAGQSLNASGDTDMVVWRYNQDGSLDITFDGDGYFVHHNAAGGNGDDRTIDHAIQDDGKIVATGWSTNAAGNVDMTVWRLNTDGSLDTTFNTVGYQTHHNAAGGNHQDSGGAVSIQSDGKIVIAGDSVDGFGYYDMAVWRLNSNGSFDNTFDTDGVVIHQNSGGDTFGNDNGRDMRIQSDGKIVVVGNTRNPVNGYLDMCIWRLNSDGSLDTTFDTDGIFTHDSATGANHDDLAYGVDIQSDGKIVTTGFSKDATGQPDMAVWRVNATGGLDTTFNTVGYAVHANVAGNVLQDFGDEIYQQADGKLPIVGASISGNGDYVFVMWRYNSDGTLDTTFDDVGYILHDNAAGGNHNDQGRGMALLGNNDYIATGYSTAASGGADMTLWKFTDLITAEDTAGIEVNVADVIALDCGADVDFGTVTPGTPVTAETTCTATTNAENGYTLQVKREDTDTTMDHTTDDTANITDKAAWTSGSPNATTAIDDVLGFGVYASTATKNTTWWGTGTACDDASNNYAGFPSAYDTIMTHSTYSATGTTTSVCYKVDLPSNQKSGSYDGVVVYQVYTNP